MLGISRSPLGKRAKVISGGTSPINASTQAWIDQVILNGGSVTDREKPLVNDVILKQKADNNFDENDRQWLHCVSNPVAAKTSINNPSSPMIAEVNGDLFIPYEGFQGDSLTQYIDTNYNPSIDGVKYTLNSASMSGNSLLEIPPGEKYLMGLIDAGNYILILPTYGALFYGGLNGGQGTFPPNDKVKGFFAVSREFYTTLKSYINGVFHGEVSTLSTLVPNGNIFLLAANNAGPTLLTNSLLSNSSIGSGAIDQAQFYNSIEPFVQEQTNFLYRGLIAGYNLNGDASDVMNTFNGVPTNVSWVAGKKGQGVHILGTASEVFLGDLLNASKGSISMWVKKGTSSPQGYPLFDSLGAYNLAFFSVPNIVFNLYTGVSSQVSAPITDDVWEMFTWTYDGVNLKVYKNGVIVQTASNMQGDIQQKSAMKFGRQAEPNDFVLDLVGFWNRPLTDAEILNLYNEGNGALLTKSKK